MNQTTKPYHPTAIRMATIKKIITNVNEDVERENTSAL